MQIDVGGTSKMWVARGKVGGTRKMWVAHREKIASFTFQISSAASFKCPRLLLCTAAACQNLAVSEMRPIRAEKVGNKKSLNLILTPDKVTPSDIFKLSTFEIYKLV